MNPTEARAYLDLAQEYGLRSIRAEDFHAEFWVPSAPAPVGAEPGEDPACPCGHPPEMHSEAGCLCGCDPAKCEAKP